MASETRFLHGSQSPIPLRFLRRKSSDSQLLTKTGVHIVDNMSQAAGTGSPILVHLQKLESMAANENLVDATPSTSESLISEELRDVAHYAAVRRRRSSVLPVVEIPSLSLENHPTLMGLFLTEAAEQENDTVQTQ